MPAKTANQFNEFSIEDSNQTIRIFYLKVPFPFIVDVRPEYTEDAVACAINHSQPMIIQGLFENKEEIAEQMKKDGYFIKSIRQMTFQISEICQICNKRGVPSILRKNTDSSYYKIRGWYSPREKIKVKGKNQPFWLRYYHKDTRKTCWVQQWQGSIKGTFKEKIKTKQIDPRKYFISTAIKKAKEISGKVTLEVH